MKPISIKLPDDLLIKVDLYAMNKRLSRSDVIREALERYLKAELGV
jgi:metal-responsive CopG/Arc/MetJ family transcriptional regulator